MSARYGFQDRETLKKALSSDLGYVWTEPSAPYPLPHRPFWMDPDQDAKEALIEELIEEEWKVAFIRQQIEMLGIRPKGRSRATLVRQLVDGFLDQERLQTAFDRLTSEERQYYLCLLLNLNLEGANVYTEDMGSVCTVDQSDGALMQRLVMTGLGLQTPFGDFFFPHLTLGHLSRTALEFPEAEEPDTYTPAASPHRLLLGIQQLITFIQSREDTLRPQPRWRIPNLPYESQTAIWPPMPEDAESLLSNPTAKRAIELMPMAPFLDDEALDAWTQALDLSETEVEFIYHLLVSAGLIHSGSPVRLEFQLMEKWLTFSPGRQLSVLYKLYCGLGQWAAWTPRWREGDVHVYREFYETWDLMGTDRTLFFSRYLMRWAVLTLLSFLPHETWIEVEAVEDWMMELFPSLDTHRYLYNLDIRAEHGGWQAFLETVLKVMLTGPLYSLGFVDLAPSRNAVTAFRLHRLQDLQWQRIEEAPIQSIEALTPESVHLSKETQQLEVEAPAPPSFLTFVQTWAEPAGVGSDVLRYELDVPRLHRAFEKGQTPETLARTWEDHVGFEPPGTLDRWWKEWWERYGRVRLYRDQAVLMTQDEFTMQELQLALPKLDDVIRGWATPQAALLNPDRVDEVLSDMERQGYMPQEDASDGRS